MRTCFFKLSIFCFVLTLISLTQVNVLSTTAQVPNSIELEATNLYKAGENYLKSNQLLAARSQLDRSLQLYEKLNDREGKLKTSIALAEVYYRETNYRQALQILQQADREASTESNRQQQGRLLTIKGLIYLETGEYVRALFALQQAQSSEIGDLDRSNRIRIGLGEAYRYLGWYSKALGYLEMAIRVVSDRNDRGRALNAIGEVYFELGEFDRALNFYDRALRERQNNGDRLGAIRTLNNLGQIYRQTKESNEAIAYYQQALREANALGDMTSRVYILNNLGETYLETNRQVEALDSLQEALNISRNNLTVARVQTLNHLGKYYRQRTEYDKAIENYQEALGWSQKFDSRAYEGKALVGMGETYLKSKQIDRAIASLESGIEIFESLRPGLQNEQKISLFETQDYAYQLLQKALIEVGKYQSALVVAEKGRARAFAELLVQRISESNQTEDDSQPLTLAQIQTVAKNAKATLVEYSILKDDRGQESELLIWLVKPTGEILFKQINLQSQETGEKTGGNSLENALMEATRGQQTTSLSSLAWSVRETMLNRSNGQTKSAAPSTQKAYQLLIQPIAELLSNNPQEKVIFIPHKSLFLIPFHALQDSSGKYLIEQHTISIAPSIQILSLTQKNKSNANLKDALIVGNPSPMPENLTALPGAEAEAQDVAKLLQTKALTEKQATKKAVLTKISQASIIHLATHGLFNERQGLQSYLALAPSEQQDGLLTAEEVLNLSLKANLAVLSACSTGRGQITGDGVIGLSRSFMSAGVPSVVVSLWNIPDLPTASLMTEFYRNWQQSHDKSQALRQAMLTVMKENPDPYNWAGFILMGQAN
jgi:CHAT domain-containing protein